MISEHQRHLVPPLPASARDTDRLVDHLVALETRLAAIDGRSEVDLDSVARIGEQLDQLCFDAGDDAARVAVIGFQHAFLRRMIESVDVLLERVVARLAEGGASDHGPTAVVLMLDHLGRGLRLHFEREERDGSLVRALEIAPRFHRRARSLHTEHRNFLACTADLMRHAQRAERSTQRWRSVRDAFQALRSALSEHERAETEIVQSAWNDDLGGRG